MKITERLIFDRVKYLEDLSLSERQQVTYDPHLRAQIEENLALSRIEEIVPSTPSWERLRYGVIQRSLEMRRPAQPILFSLFFDRPWYTKAAVGAILVLIICSVIWMFPTSESGSSQPNQINLEKLLPNSHSNTVYTLTSVNHQ